MFKRFSFWIVWVFLILLGSVVGIHWKTLQGMHERTAEGQALYQRQKILSSLELTLERYRRASSSFRTTSPGDVALLKDKLRSDFASGVAHLDQLNPTSEEKAAERHLNDQVVELLNASARIEPTLFSRDAYYRSEIQDLHHGILATLSDLKKRLDGRISRIQFGRSQAETESLGLLLALEGGLFALFLALMLRNYFAYVKPLKKLHGYALALKSGQRLGEKPSSLAGMHDDILTCLNSLATTVETHMEDRHKFIQDIVSDLRTPLGLLENSKDLLGTLSEKAEQDLLKSREAVRRGLAIFSGSLEDLNDIVDFNFLESRIEEKTVDLCELVKDVIRTFFGADASRKVEMNIPAIPLWVHLDSRRFERVLFHVLSKWADAAPESGVLGISVSRNGVGNLGGVELHLYDAQRVKNGKAAAAGPEQDILKHWISEKGLSLALAHKIVKAHGGTITAAGIAGSGISIAIRLPADRMRNGGLINLSFRTPMEVGVAP